MPMLKTHVRPSGDLRNSYPQMMDMLKEQDHIILTRNGKGEAVLIGIDMYAQFEEFLYEQYVAKKLAEAEAMASDPQTKWLSHEEFWARYEDKIY